MFGLALGCLWAHAQDLEAVIEDMPLVSAALLRALDGAPAFTSRAEVEVNYMNDSKPTKAFGACAWQESKLRWDINIAQVTGPLVPAQTVGAVNRLKLGPVVLLAQGDRKLATLLLSGAKAYLESRILVPDRPRNRQPFTLGNEMLDGRACTKEKIPLKFGKRSSQVMVWKPQDRSSIPAQVQISLDNGTVLVQFREPRPLAVAASQFVVPTGCTKYTDFSDLIQSLLWERMKSGLGLRDGK